MIGVVVSVVLEILINIHFEVLFVFGNQEYDFNLQDTVSRQECIH